MRSFFPNRKPFGSSQRTYDWVEMESPVAIDYTDSLVDMLDWFADQPCSCATIGHIADATGYSRETVRGNLKTLMAGDYVERRYKPTGEYRLIQDPREDEDGE